MREPGKVLERPHRRWVSWMGLALPILLVACVPPQGALPQTGAPSEEEPGGLRLRPTTRADDCRRRDKEEPPILSATASGRHLVVVAHRPCSKLPAASEAVVARIGEERFDLGRTNSQGQLRADLVSLVPRSKLVGSSPDATVMVGFGTAADREIEFKQSVDLAEVRAVVEEETYQRLASAKPSQDHLDFMTDFPRSKHLPALRPKAEAYQRQKKQEDLKVSEAERAKAQQADAKKAEEHLAELQRLAPTILKKSLSLYTKEYLSKVCDLPVETCANTTLNLIDHGPYLVIAATKTHYGIARKDTQPPFGLKDIEYWAPTGGMLDAAAYKRYAAAREKESARRDKEAEREEKKQRTADAREAKKQAATDAAKNKTWKKRFHVLVVAMHGRMNVRIKTAGKYADESVQSLLMQAMGFGKPGGETTYYQAIKMLERGATDENVFKILREVANQNGTGEEGCLVLHEVLTVPLKGAEMLFKLYDEAPSDAF